MTITPIGGGVDVPAYVADTAGNKENAIVVVPVNADGTPTGGGGGSQTSPTIVGGEYATTLPTLTNGQTDALQLTTNGKVVVALTNSTGSQEVAVATPTTDALSTANAGVTTRTFNYVFNGSSFDRMRGDTVSMFSRNAPRTKSGSALTAASTTSQQAFAANSLRTRLLIQNQDAAINIFVNLGAAATTGGGSLRIGPGGSLDITGTSEVVNIIAASGTPAITAWEF